MRSTVPICVLESLHVSRHRSHLLSESDIDSRCTPNSDLEGRRYVLIVWKDLFSNVWLYIPGKSFKQVSPCELLYTSKTYAHINVHYLATTIPLVNALNMWKIEICRITWTFIITSYQYYSVNCGYQKPGSDHAQLYMYSHWNVVR